MLAEPVDDIVIWCRTPDARWAKCHVRLDVDWWIASPEVLKAAP